MKNILQLYKWLFRHWGYLISGLFFMFSFALFSGASLTMVIPLFDYVFAPRTTTAVAYSTFSEFSAALSEAVHQFLIKAGAYWRCAMKQCANPWQTLLKMLCH
ncbi:MAG: hypothetical protein SCK70_07125 [bacterium]|nr:hypothetical protein [bacterium]